MGFSLDRNAFDFAVGGVDVVDDIAVAARHLLFAESHPRKISIATDSDQRNPAITQKTKYSFFIAIGPGIFIVSKLGKRVKYRVNE
jgi:hypothetical protein